MSLTKAGKQAKAEKRERARQGHMDSYAQYTTRENERVAAREAKEARREAQFETMLAALADFAAGKRGFVVHHEPPQLTGAGTSEQRVRITFEPRAADDPA